MQHSRDMSGAPVAREEARGWSDWIGLDWDGCPIDLAPGLSLNWSQQGSFGVLFPSGLFYTRLCVSQLRE